MAGRRVRTMGLALVSIALAIVSAACWVPYDVDGNLKADLVYIDESSDNWYRVGSPDAIGGGGGQPAMGNYDGQGSWELAEVLTQTGVWRTSGARGTFSFPPPTPLPVPGFPQINGVHSDFAVPARYDGNGTTVPAWFRVADATWFIEGHDPIQFGAPSVASPPQFDIPVPGDYNGDGIDELAVYHPSDSTFHVQGVADPIPLGNVGDQPAPADYDGDGRTDPATFAVGTSGVWHIAGKPDVIYPVTTSPNDELFPAPANYDGQGGAEPAVARFTVGPDTIWQISTLGDFDLAGSRIPGPTSFNDTISTLMLAGVQHYCATHTC